MIDFQLDILNSNSKLRYQIGGSYGKVSLELCSMETTGIRSISMGNTKAELYHQLVVFNDITHHEKTNKIDRRSNCTHLDVFNINHFNGEKRNVSHIREYAGKYQCLCCEKTFNEAQYEKSIIPRSADELRKMRIEN